MVPGWPQHGTGRAPGYRRVTFDPGPAYRETPYGWEPVDAWDKPLTPVPPDSRELREGFTFWLIRKTVEYGAPPREAVKWWLYIFRRMKEIPVAPEWVAKLRHDYLLYLLETGYLPPPGADMIVPSSGINVELLMTDSSRVHYLMIIDRSGSMGTIEKDMNGGLQSFIGEQLEGVDPARRTLSLYQFDTVHDTVYDFALLEKARDYRLVPRGATALLDACGYAIKGTGEKLAAMPEHERPGYVMVLIVTDGLENSSHEYTRAQVKEMIQHQQDKYGWRFTYLGANQDAFAEASSIGVAYPSVLSWLGTSRSTRDMWATASAGVSAGTVPTSTGIYYTAAQREEVART